ncbi:MAG: hypothetical protein P8048_11990 [Calditrichia bacterium]
MAKYKEFSGKLAVGLFVEGHYLHVACLSKKDNTLQLIDGQVLKMSKALESVRVQQEIFSDSADAPEIITPQTDDDSITFEEAPEKELNLSGIDAENYDNMEVLQRVLYKYPSNKFRMGISLAEPQIYYTPPCSRRPCPCPGTESPPTEPASRDGRLMAIVRESQVNVINSLQYLQTENRKVLPKISFVESAETSLVNLINANYYFEDEDFTVVVYMGNEYSRLIFLQGHEIFNISYIIGAGLDSENITHTIYSRILLEQDNLNLPKVQNIILAGEAHQVSLREFLKEKLSEEIKIDYLTLPNLEIYDEEIEVSKYAIAIGAAWRTQNDKEKFLYDVDLLPDSFRESQKKFKLGLIGWLLLFTLPAIAYFTTIKISEQREVLKELIAQQQYHQEELDYLKGIEAKLNERRTVLANYEKAFGVLDEMSAGIDKWNKFLHKLSINQDKIGRIWITEIIPTADNEVVLKGYAVYRDRIPRLSQVMGAGALKIVQVQAIRERTVYYFEMSATLIFYSLPLSQEN